jgi:hypothetical protein
MYLRRTLGLGLAVVTAAAIVIAAAGAGTTHVAIKKIDLSTTAAVKKYLRSIHVNPKRVVVQRGARNYAGPSCPGTRWNCTSTARPVVQISRGAGKNLFECSTSKCSVVQSSPAPVATNTAKCIKTMGISQSCSITQSSATANNRAIVFQDATKLTGLTQNGSQTAQIFQTASGGSTVANGNEACVTQRMNLSAQTTSTKGTPVSSSLDAHQTITISQDSPFGANVAHDAASGGASCGASPVEQTQSVSQTATGRGGITQNENATAAGPNMLLGIQQNPNTPNAEGTNTADFRQTSTLTATAYTPVGPVSQTQGSSGGGLKATISQFSHGESHVASGVMPAKQSETQTQHAAKSTTDDTLPPNTTQTQIGPVRCCSNQADNPNDTLDINQESTQDNDTHDSQTQTNNLQVDCSTSGECDAKQTTTVDGSTTVNDPPPGQNVSASTTCSGSDCTTGPEDNLTVSNTDVKEFGFGGMRGNGTGSITVSGVSGVTKAVLFWNGPTNSTDPTANASVNFGGTPITGTNIGFASSNCWPFANSQSYRADVTPLVTGNGSYSLSNFNKPPDVEINGVALIVFYDDGNSSNDRNFVMFNGNDSTIGSTFEPANWDETIANVPYPGSGAASLDFVVSDGQSAGEGPDDGALVVNETTIAPAGGNFQGDTTPHGSFDASGDLWDVKPFDITSVLTSGSNDLHLTSPHVNDCLSLVVAGANVPASSIITSPAGPQQQSATAQAGSTPAPSRQSTRALPWAPEFGGLLRTAPSPLHGVRSGGVLVQR